MAQKVTKPVVSRVPRKVTRVNVTLTPEAHEAMMEWAEVTGFAPPQLVALIMTNSLPVIRAMTQAMRVAKSDPRRAMEIMGELVGDATVVAAQASLEFAQETPKSPRRTTKQKRA